MADGSIARGANNIQTGRIFHPVLNGDVHTEKFTWCGNPWQPLPVTDPNGVSAAGLYPLDGDGVLDAASAGGGTLDATGVPTAVDLTGFVICIVSGTGIGQVRPITSYNTGTRAFTVAPNWTVTPTGASYVVGIDTFGRGQLTVKAELEGSADTVDVHAVLFGFPWNVPTTGADAGLLGVTLNATGRTPVRGLGRVLTFNALNYQVGVTKSGFYHAETVLTEDVRGATFCKLYLRTVPAASRKVVLHAGAS